jgi:hypothetical protein
MVILDADRSRIVSTDFIDNPVTAPTTPAAVNSARWHTKSVQLFVTDTPQRTSFLKGAR